MTARQLSNEGVGVSSGAVSAAIQQLERLLARKVRKGRAALLKEIVRAYRSANAQGRRATREAFAFEVVCSERYWELIAAERVALDRGLEERVWALSRQAKKEQRIEGNPDLSHCLETHFRVTAFRRFKNGGRVAALRDFLAAWTITSGSGDARDDMLLLSDIEEIAEAHGIDPRPLFREAARLADPKKEDGGWPTIGALLQQHAARP